MVDGPVGFWSYVHDDNDAVDGGILELRRLIRNAYSIVTGEELTLFVDTEINWGEEWENRISQSISGTTFFIPIITPRFFKSKACRQEVIDFTAKAEASGLGELFLPILYTDVPGLSVEAEDAVMRLVAKTQFVRWSELRLLASDSPEHRAAVHKLAVEIDRISTEVGTKPEAVRIVPADASGADSDKPEPSDDDAPGTLDLIAKAEEAMSAWIETIQLMAACLESVGEVPRNNQAALDRATKESSMGPRLAVIRKTAMELEAPTQQFLDLATTYASQLIDVNAGVDAIIHLQPFDEMTPDEQAEFRSFADTMRELRDAGAVALSAAQVLGDSLKGTVSLSRDMRKPTTNLQRGIERLGDGQGIFDEWVKGFEDAGVWDAPPATSPAEAKN